MWKLICKNGLSHQLTILVTWSKTKQPNNQTTKQTQQHTQTTDVKLVLVKASLFGLSLA